MHPLEEKAKDLFGYTNEYQVPAYGPGGEYGSAFLLTDGSWLGRGRRFLAHHDMAAAILGRRGGFTLEEFMSKTGAIRILLNMKPGRLGLHIQYSSETPSAEQIEAIYGYCGSNGDPKIDGWDRCYGFINRGNKECGNFSGGLRQLVDGLERCRV